jgi:mannan endo-1,4-beta-mannosidase
MIFPKLIVIPVAFLALFFIGCSTPATSEPDKTIQVRENWPIITRVGDKLMEGDKEFRFMGFAAPNIQQNESQLRTDMQNRFPDEFEIRDILGALEWVGSRATRTFSLSVYSPEDNLPVYIPARRTYNEEAFKTLDMVIALAHEYDVRILIPLIASQRFGGIRGVDEFSDLAGKTRGSFWTDEDVKADFKHFLDFVLNRKNTVNGLLYKEDPAILAWQLGNEFGSYGPDRGMPYDEWKQPILEWSLEMAAYIKSVDPNHLVMEAGGADRQAFIDDPNIDIISEHLYEYWNKLSGQPYHLSPIARESVKQTRGKKPLMVDEFGLGSIENQNELMQTIREEGIVGGLMWSIRGRRRDGGWYYHNEGGTHINSFHAPGFASSFHYDEIRILETVRREAYLIRGESIPPAKKPTPAPILMQQKDGFTWRGSTGAAFYTIERSESENGIWTAIATGLHDSVIADVKAFEYTPEASEPLVLYNDATAEPGKTYYYRIKGVNVSGESEYSNILKVN